MIQKTHYFFAAKIPLETKEVIQNQMEEFKTIFPFSRWVYHADLHITLAFLGAAESEKLALAVEKVRVALADVQSFTLQIDGIGVFGREQFPRVFWAAVAPSAELQSIRNKVYKACEQVNFQLETRPFRPHITLARKWNSDRPFQKEQLKFAGKLQPESLSFNVAEVVLYETQLQQLPKYKELVNFPLRTKGIDA
ncbi:RNA 2',3'-cyclic phosphodiesterase [Bacillus rubiinfantis]|uniref:RNA 2',3'-cyclic phosphodiesterase n=1 Tax=Bacillus rubiinfantis TaxID=1499680 RepID=UPI0005A9B5B8|nr:RNA 2',3'-cyclic phosphodiesterase [Bacillus rubiinfantis]